MMRAVLLWLSVTLVLSGCSLRQMATRSLADALSEGGASVYAADDDPVLVRDALPFGLKTFEVLLVELPRHRGLLRAACRGFTSYAVAFILPEVQELETMELERARRERVRARRMFLRAREYGLRALEVAHPGFAAELREDPQRTVQRAGPDDVPDLYWLAAAWGSAISAARDDMDLLADLGVVEALIRRALDLDEAYEEGVIHEFLIAFESRGEAMGGSLARARRHFKRAMELSNGRRVAPLVSLAEHVSVQTQNREEFQWLLDKVLSFDPDTAPDVRLQNLVAQRRARGLQARADDLFLLDDPSLAEEKP
jgi:predicted anti-sigma-YlaC factor YlaD